MARTRLRLAARRRPGRRDALSPDRRAGTDAAARGRHRALRRRSGGLWRARQHRRPTGDRADRLRRPDAADGRLRCTRRPCAATSRRCARAAPRRTASAACPRRELETTGHVRGERITATLQVPGEGDAPYFADHFPRRPVFPGTLLIDALAGLAVQLASEALPRRPAADAGLDQPMSRSARSRRRARRSNSRSNCSKARASAPG